MEKINKEIVDELEGILPIPKLNRAVHMLFPERVKLAERRRCVECKSEIRREDFIDRQSIREYSISGLCQSCQDKVFK